MGVYKCPVCEGKGQVIAGFYSDSAVTKASNTCTEVCRSCKGKGIVFDSEAFNEVDQHSTSYVQHDYSLTTAQTMKSCSDCWNNDEVAQDSVQCKCTLDGKLHKNNDACEFWCPQPLTLS